MKKQYIIPLVEIENADMTEIIATSLPLETEGIIKLGTDEVLVPQDESIWESLDMENLL